MNKGQIMSAVGDLEEALRLIHSAEDKLQQNGIMLCGINPLWFGSDGIHVWCGIEEPAEAAGQDVVIDEGAPNRDKGFMRNDVKYYQIALEDGTYRERSHE